MGFFNQSELVYWVFQQIRVCILCCLANQLVTPLAATVGVLVFVLLVSGVIKHYKQYLFEFRVYASTWTVDLSQLQDVKGGGSKVGVYYIS